MTYRQARRRIEALGYKIVAQTCHGGRLVSFDALDLDPSPRKRLIRGPIGVSEPAMVGLLNQVELHHLDKP